MAPSSRSPALTAATASIASIAGILGILYYLDIPTLLQQRVKSRQISSRCYATDSEDNMDKNKPSLAAFKILTQQTTLKETYPLAASISQNVPIYDCARFDLEKEAGMERLKDEWYHILLSGPGVFVLKHFSPADKTNIIDGANAAYAAIIEREASSNKSKGDHFAPGSANARIWNSFSKHCLESPRNFTEYFSNPLFTHVCSAYLGPDYRITTQVNIVKPGGKAQVAHRDYHLGFQTAEAVGQWPKAMHAVSKLLTLQGAVAHTNMPVESGPTRLLPFSQMFEEGFVAYRLPEFNEYFLQNYVSLALAKGDAMFFSPALFHAAGENRTEDFERSANLIQVSSAFGKTMETVDSLPLVERCWDLMAEKYSVEGMSAEVDALVRAVGEGYPFPTNLDRRPPAPGGMAPESEQGMFRRALAESWSREKVVAELKEMRHASAA